MDDELQNLPIVNINSIKEKFSLSEQEQDIIEQVLYKPINGVGTIRNSKPHTSPEAAWVWRTCMSHISSEERFQIVNPQIDHALGKAGEVLTFYRVYLMSIVDKILSVIPDEQRHGEAAWKRASKA